jgi:hypothetical protein
MAQESIGVDICFAEGQASCSGVNLAFGGVVFFPYAVKLCPIEGMNFFQNGTRGVTLGWPRSRLAWTFVWQGGQTSCSGVNLAFGVLRGVRVFLFSAKLVLPGPIKTADLRSSRFQNPKQQV